MSRRSKGKRADPDRRRRGAAVEASTPREAAADAPPDTGSAERQGLGDGTAWSDALRDPGTALPSSLHPGLHFVATPIGAARDVTLRTLDALAAADLLIAEDTRTLRRLMEIHGVPLGGRPLLAYHDRNADAARPAILQRLRAGARAVYASEAGTPLIADPGWKLARAAREEAIAVSVLPGPCAAIAGLVLSGAPTDAFAFLGFPPPRRSARRKFFARWSSAPGSLIVYESPRRLAESLNDMAATLGDRHAAIVREITKRFEETRRGTLTELTAALERDGPPKGEVVVVLYPASDAAVADETLDEALKTALATLSLRDSAREVAEALGVGRKEAYRRAVDVARSLERSDQAETDEAPGDA